MPDTERFQSQTQKATLSHEEMVTAARNYRPLAATDAERAAIKSARNVSSVSLQHDYQPHVASHRLVSHARQRCAASLYLLL